MTAQTKPIRADIRFTDTECWDKFRTICQRQGRSINVTINMLVANYVEGEDHALSYPTTQITE